MSVEISNDGLMLEAFNGSNGNALGMALDNSSEVDPKDLEMTLPAGSQILAPNGSVLYTADGVDKTKIRVPKRD